MGVLSKVLKKLTLSNIASLAVLVVVSVVFFMQTYPVKILDVYITSFPPVKGKFYPGEELTVRGIFCKKTELPAHTQVQLTRAADGYSQSINLGRRYLKPNCYDIKYGLMNLPTNLPAGIYIGTINMKFEVNPFRTIEYNIVIQPFEILPGKVIYLDQ